MANYYGDHPELKFHLGNPLMERIVELKEHDFDYDEAMDNYDKVMAIAGEVASDTVAPNAESVDLEGPCLEEGHVRYASGTSANLDACTKAGLWGVTMPRRYDGLNFPVTVFSMMSEAFAAADPGFQTIWSLQNCADTINAFGSEEQRAKFIPRVCKGETMSMDLTEPDAGSDLQSVMLKATFDQAGNCWRLNGVKRFITNGDADIHLVLARTEEGSRDGSGLSLFIYDKNDGGVSVRHLESKMGLHGSPTCEITYRDAKAELCGVRRMGLIKYVMSLMNSARLGVGAQSVGLMQAAYDEALAYAGKRLQFGKAIVDMPPVYDMLSRMKSKLDAGRSLLYQTARYVDIYKALESISRERPLSSEEKAECKKYMRLADAFTPVAKGMLSEYANQCAYDAMSVLGGSGYMMEYKTQRLLRDARVFSIYEGTTQMQVVAAGRYILNGTYSAVFQEMLSNLSGFGADISGRVYDMVSKYGGAVDRVRSFEDRDIQSFLSRKLFDMTGSILMSLLLLSDAARSPEFFGRSANAYVLLAESAVAEAYTYVISFRPEDLDSFKVR